jgi:hypothetical protein
MSNEEKIRSLLLNLLRTGVLRIRAFAHEDLADRCAIEADHIHNLPDLIRNPRLELLTYYFDCERRAFIKRAPNSDAFEPDWLRLGEIIEELRAVPKQKQ